jgi:hypothetical protein
MTLVCEVLEEVNESFVGKRGPRIVRLWVCLDRGSGKTLRNTFDYVVTPEEQEKFGGKAAGKLVELAISEIRCLFGGRARFKGEVQRFSGEDVNGKR